MDSISIMDGLILTVVSMIVVFTVLAAIWGLVEVVAKIIQRIESKEVVESSQLISNQKHQLAAEMMALVLASEDQPDKKFEIIESKRVK